MAKMEKRFAIKLVNLPYPERPYVWGINTQWREPDFLTPTKVAVYCTRSNVWGLTVEAIKEVTQHFKSGEFVLEEIT